MINYAKLNAIMDDFTSDFQRTGLSSDALDCFYDFLKEGKFLFDGKLVDPDKFPWLLPIYKLKRADILAGRYKSGIVLFKAAQMGATVAILLFIIWLCIGSEELKIGFFFPTEGDLNDLVKLRLDPLVRGNDIIRQYIPDSAVDNTRGKQIGNSTVFFRYTKGKAQADSIPLDIVIIDEVRLLEDQNIVERLDQRLRQSDIATKIYVSTAGNPGDVMDRTFQQSNQFEWHSRCEDCTCINEKSNKRGKILVDMEIPEYIRRLDDGDAEYFCNTTGEIFNPIGFDSGYEECNAGSAKTTPFGVHFPAFLSPKVSAYEILKQYETAVDRKEFWNSVMGRTYNDPAGKLVNLTHLLDAKAAGSNLHWLDSNDYLQCVAGVDVRSDELHVVVLAPAEIGARLVKIDVLQGEDMFKQLEDLIYRYSIKIALIDLEPLTPIVKAFARRVDAAFIADYNPGGLLIRRRKDQNDINISDDIQDRKTYILNRPESLKTSLGMLARGSFAIPNEPVIKNEFIDARRRKHSGYDLLANEFFPQMQAINVKIEVKRVVGFGNQKQESSGETETKIVSIGADHFAHAFNYAVMALQLNSGEDAIVLKAKPRAPTTAQTQNFGLREIDETRRCGNCMWFLSDTSTCKQFGWNVKSSQAACTYPGAYRRMK